MLKISSNLIFTFSLVLLFFSCKEEPLEEATPKNENNKVQCGCNDINATNYSSGSTCSDGCNYLYATKIGVVDFESGSWDPLGGDPDIYVRIKPDGSSNWRFESQRVDNVSSGPLDFIITPSVKLTNADWKWEIVDYDLTSSDDVIASGTFNPIQTFNSAGSFSLSSSNGQTNLKIYYTAL